MIPSLLKDRAIVWLVIALSTVIFISVVIAAGLTTTGSGFREGLGETGSYQIMRLPKPYFGSDSWTPMLKAYLWKTEDPKRDLYAVFFDDQVKFQYPPSSLLIFDLFPAPMLKVVNDLAYEPLVILLGQLSRIAVVLTSLASAAILAIGLRRLEPDQPVQPVRIIAQVILATLLGLVFYPVLKAHQLGQIQTFLNCLVALGLLFYMLKWKTLSGVCFGICCLVKPQYGLVLLWSLLRRSWGFAGGLVGVLTIGLLLSVARFGLQDHFQYLKVLQAISRVGESFWANQSVNGLLNRFMGNGNAVNFSLTDFATYNPTVYTITLITSLLFLLLAFWLYGRGRLTSGNLLDLAVVLAAATIASPVAWEHHYGAFLPIFAVAFPGVLALRPFGRATAPLFLFSYVAMANVMIRPELIFVNRWWGLIGSHLFFGSLVLFGLLLVLRAKGWNSQTSPAVRWANNRQEPKIAVRPLAADSATLDPAAK